MVYIYQCPLCKRYRMDDGSWEHPDIKQLAMMLFLDKWELKETICDDCERWRR